LDDEGMCELCQYGITTQLILVDRWRNQCILVAEEEELERERGG